MIISIYIIIVIAGKGMGTIGTCLHNHRSKGYAHMVADWVKEAQIPDLVTMESTSKKKNRFSFFSEMAVNLVYVK